MELLVRLRTRPSRDGKTFKYFLDYKDESGRPDESKFPYNMPIGEKQNVKECKKSVSCAWAL